MPTFDPNDLLTAALTAVGTLSLFLLKEQFDKKRAKQKEEQERLDYFKAYTDPLLEYCYSLQKRLFDIFKHKAKFVYKTAQINEFQEYHYISTLYRLCAVLGWVRAVNRELAGVELTDNETYRGLKATLKDFSHALTNKEYIESGRLEYLGRKWNLDLSTITDDKMKVLDYELNNLIWAKLIEENVPYVKDLNTEEQDKLLSSLANKVVQEAKVEALSEEVINHSHDQIISVLSRKEAWIYSNWQQAIGDMMLKPARHNKMRSFEVLGFREFEEMYLKLEAEEHSNNRWIKRVDALFRDLDIKKDAIFDARIPLLKNIHTCLIKLIDSLERLSGEPDEELRQKLQNLADISLDELGTKTEKDKKG